MINNALNDAANSRNVFATPTIPKPNSDGM